MGREDQLLLLLLLKLSSCWIQAIRFELAVEAAAGAAWRHLRGGIINFASLFVFLLFLFFSFLCLHHFSLSARLTNEIIISGVCVCRQRNPLPE